jgi:hypothetical protein
MRLITTLHIDEGKGASLLPSAIKLDHREDAQRVLRLPFFRSSSSTSVAPYLPNQLLCFLCTMYLTTQVLL